MRADNRTRNENNAVCQPRNPACHSRTFAILGVFHEQSSTRKLNFKFNSSSSALIPELRPRKSCSSFASMTATLCVFSPERSHSPSESCQSSTLLIFNTKRLIHIYIKVFAFFFFKIFTVIFFSGFSWISQLKLFLSATFFF